MFPGLCEVDLREGSGIGEKDRYRSLTGRVCVWVNINIQCVVVSSVCNVGIIN